MPSRGRKRTRSYSRSRSRSRTRSKRRVRARTRRSRVRFWRNPLGQERTRATLRYNTILQLDPKPDILGSTGNNVWQFVGNACYDPDLTGIGHQPLYFDNYASVYERYHVTYATISVTVVNHFVNTAVNDNTTNLTRTQPNYAYKLAILRDVSGVTNEYPTQMTTMIEEGGPNIKWRYVGPSLTGRLPKLKFSMSPAKMANRPWNDQTLHALTNANPIQPCSFYVAITSADGVTDPPSVYLDVVLKQHVIFYDRKNIQSQN